jgi:hypothetical protein
MRPRFALVLAPLLAVAFALASCSGETEGQPCDPAAGNSGNDDCASGLVCTTVSAAEGSRCCPADRTTAKSPDCALSTTTEQDANPEPPDTSTADTTAPETGGEAAAEAGHDGGASGEAAVEASAGEAGAD